MKTKAMKLAGLLITMMILIATLGAFSITVSASTTSTLYIGELSLYNQYTVDGVTAISGAPGDAVESYAHWDYESSTLTLKNFNQTITAREYVADDTYYGIGYDGNLNLVLIGDSSITVNPTDDYYQMKTFGIYVNKTLTITGDGSLAVSSPNYAIFGDDGITANCSGKIITNATAGGTTAVYSNETIDIQQGVITIAGGKRGISAKNIKIKNATVTATSGSDSAISSRSNITIKNSTVSATLKNPDSVTALDGIYADNSVTVEDSYLEATGSVGSEYVAGNGLRANGDINIENSTVSATGGAGIRCNGSSLSIRNSLVSATGTNSTNSYACSIHGSSVSIDAGSTVTAESVTGAFNHAPTVAATEVKDCTILYGEDEATANQAQSLTELSENFTQKYVHIHIHEWNDGVVTTNPTCSAVGTKTFTCTHKSAHTYTEDVAIDENAHAWNSGVVTTAPTCTEKGVKTFTCTHNSTHTYTEDVVIDENAHAWNDGFLTTNPTCSAVGTKIFTCTHNGEHTKTEDVAIDENAHTWNNGVITTIPLAPPLAQKPILVRTTASI